MSPTCTVITIIIIGMPWSSKGELIREIAMRKNDINPAARHKHLEYTYLKDILGAEEDRQKKYLKKAVELHDLEQLDKYQCQPRPFAESLCFAWHGLLYAFKTERNMRIHAVCAAIALLVGAIMHFSTIEMAFLFLVIAMVLLLELVNTALELTLDHTHGSEYHPLVKIIKDVVAGGVLLAALNAVLVGGILILRHIL